MSIIEKSLKKEKNNVIEKEEKQTVNVISSFMRIKS